jgi:hypothetical protein
MSLWPGAGIQKTFLSFFTSLRIKLVPCSGLSRCAPRIFRWGGGGADSEAMYNLCLIVKIIKIML